MMASVHQAWSPTGEQEEVKTSLSKQFSESGIVHTKSLLKDNTLARSSNWIDQVVELGSSIPSTFQPEFEPDAKDNQCAVRKLRRLYWNDPEFWSSLIQEAQIDELARTLIGAPVALVFHAAFLKPARVGSAVALHQDQALWSQVHPKAVNIWVALSKVDADNGGLTGCPGSHRRGLLPHIEIEDHPWHPGVDWREQNLAQPITYELEPGDALAWDRFFVHGSGANRSGRDRRSFVMVFVDRTAPDFNPKDRADF